MKVWKTRPWTRLNDMTTSRPPLPTLSSFDQKLVPQTTLDNLSLESLFHSPTYSLEFVYESEGDEIRIAGENACLYTPAFAITPMHTTASPQLHSRHPLFPRPRHPNRTSNILRYASRHHPRKSHHTRQRSPTLQPLH